MDVNFKFHFVTDECELKSLVLNVKCFPYTRFGISQETKTILIDYDLTDFALQITNHRRNMLVGIRNLNIVVLFCFPHTLQLVIFDTRKETINFSKTLKKARKIVGCYYQR